MYGQRTPLWMVVGAVLATVTVVRSTCGDAAAVYPGKHVWRPCRAALQRRRYEDIAPTAVADDGTDEEQRYWDGGAEEDGADDGSADDVYAQPPYSTMDDKLKRGVRVAPPTQNRQFEKKFNRPLSATGVAAAGPGNTLRMDPSLLRGETVELPTYVNVPVTLRCKFVPVDGADNKFETIVEAMFPGHADGPPPPDDSPASRILKQLAGSVDGWRGVVNKSARPVRRVIENRFGRWVAWPQAGVDWTAPTAAKPLRYDADGRQIFARLRAAERAQRYHGTGRQQYHGGSSNPVEDQPEVVDDLPDELQQSDDGPIAERLAENQLIDDDQSLAERLDDRPIADRMQRLHGVRQQDHHDWYTGKRPDIVEQVVRERIDDLPSEQVAERVQGMRQQNHHGWYTEKRPEVVQQEAVQEQVDDLLNEQVDDRLSGQADDQPIEQVDDRLNEQDEDRPGEQVDDRQVTERVHGVRQQKHRGWYTERRPEVVVQEQVDDQLSEQVDDRQTARLRATERVQRLHGGRQQDHRGRYAEDRPEVVGQVVPELVSDGRAVEDVDYRQTVQDGEQADTLDSLMPEITTTAKWDYATLGRGIPVRTYMEQGFSTPSDQYGGSESL